MFAGMNVSDLFFQFFGGRGAGLHGFRSKGVPEGRDREAGIALTLEEAYLGVEKQITLAGQGQGTDAVSSECPPRPAAGRNCACLVRAGLPRME